MNKLLSEFPISSICSFDFIVYHVIVPRIGKEEVDTPAAVILLHAHFVATPLKGGGVLLSPKVFFLSVQ
jgi:hypothetical protein